MATSGVDPRIEKTDQLIGEVVSFLPLYTSHWGSFNSFEQSGYAGRNPASWQRECLELLDGALLADLRPDTADVLRLTEVVNTWTIGSPAVEYQLLDGSTKLLPVSSLATVLGYALLEMIVRKLIPPGAPHSLGRLLPSLEDKTRSPALASSLRSLNGSMGLYTRLRKGRDNLLHGRGLRAAEGEGLLLAPLIDLILLHIMKRELEAA